MVCWVTNVLKVRPSDRSFFFRFFLSFIILYKPLQVLCVCTLHIDSVQIHKCYFDVIIKISYEIKTFCIHEGYTHGAKTRQVNLKEKRSNVLVN